MKPMIKHSLSSQSGSADIYDENMKNKYIAKASDDRIIIRIEKKLFNLSDTYVVNINNMADEVPLLLLAAAIDASNLCKK